MKTIYLVLLLLPTVFFGQNKNAPTKAPLSINNYIKSVDNLTLDAALEVNKRVTEAADALNKKTGSNKPIKKYDRNAIFK